MIRVYRAGSLLLAGAAFLYTLAWLVSADDVHAPRLTLAAVAAVTFWTRADLLTLRARLGGAR